MKEVLPINYVDLLKKYQINDKDTGSSKVQILHLTSRINSLSLHLRKFKKDLHSLRGLVTMLNKRKKLLQYVKNKAHSEYKDILSDLHIRK